MTLTDFCNTTDERTHHRTSRSPLSGMPSGTLVLAHSREEMREALRAGGATGLLPRHPPDRALPSEGGTRRARPVTSSAVTRAPPVALSGLACEVEETSCCPGAPRPGFHAPSRKGTLLHESRCIPPSGVGYVRRDRSRPSAPSWPPRPFPLPSSRRSMRGWEDRRSYVTRVSLAP